MPPEIASSPATVRAIDDDPAVRAVLAAALTDAGYRVLTATNGEAQGYLIKNLGAGYTEATE